MGILVFGLDTETVFLDDIQMDVPHARTVVIPEDKAVRSKDLWRALSQKRIFRLSHDPNLSFLAATQAPAPPEKAPVVEAARRPLEASEVTALREENACLRAQVAETQQLREQVGEILELLRSSPRTAPAATPKSKSKAKAVVSVDAPAYIPSQIRQEATEVRVEVSSEMNQGGAVSGATETLRRLRKKDENPR